MAKHFNLLFLEFKKAFTQLPKIILGTIVFAFLAVLFAFTANILLKTSDSSTKATIAIVTPENSDDYTAMLFKYVQEIDSVKGICNFINLDKETAYKKLEKNELMAAIIIPENFLANMIAGIRTPIDMVTANNRYNSISPYFKQLIRSASAELGACEAGVYAAGDALIKYSIVKDPYYWQDRLGEHYISYALNPSSYFDERPLTVAGHITMEGFYICTGIVVVLLLCGILSSEILKRDSNTFAISIKRIGISPEWHLFAKLISISTIFYTIIVAAYLICRLVSIRVTKLAIFLPSYGISELLVLFLVVLSIFSFVIFIFELCNNTSTASILLFLLSTLSLFVSGGILPSALLADGIKFLAPGMITTHYLNILKHMYVGIIETTDVIIVAIICFVLFALTCAVNQIRRRIV